MSLMDKIKALWAVNTFVNKERKALMDTPHIKSGLLTTQFWMSAIPAAVTLWAQLKGMVPQPYASYVEIACVGIYAIARSVHVTMVQIQAIKSQSSQATVTTTAPVTTVTTPAQ